MDKKNLGENFWIKILDKNLFFNTDGLAWAETSKILFLNNFWSQNGAQTIDKAKTPKNLPILVSKRRPPGLKIDGSQQMEPKNGR